MKLLARTTMVVTSLLIASVATVSAAGPVKWPDDGLPEPWVVFAGEGCAFDVLFEPTEVRGASDLEFHDRYMGHANGIATVTNLENGVSIVYNPVYLERGSYDEETDTFKSVISGSRFVNFWPGDQGPYGEVAEPGLLLKFEGRLTIASDPDTGLFTQFSSAGAITDVCALLA